MPHATLKLHPGVDLNSTPALNEASFSAANLIRFIPDDEGLGLAQTLGGWTKYYPNTIASVVRNLWAWADINSRNWLAVGAETSLSVISNGQRVNITPRTATDDVAVSVTTTSGSNLVVINDTGSNITGYDSVFIRTQISIGGLVLFGLYPCTAIDANSYSILAIDVLGDPAYATSSVTGGGAVPQYTTVSGDSTVTVTLANHDYSVGGTFPALISTTLNGVTIYGDYAVLTVPSGSTFTIQASSQATASSSAYMNAGNAEYVYYIGIGTLPSGSGFGIGGFGVGGFGSGVTPSANPGTPITATDWTLDNWGSILIASPYGGPIYTWDTTSQPPIATVIPQAPPVNAGIFVAMPQRQIVAWGSTFNGLIDPLLVRWCDIQDYTAWIGLTTNQAGSYRLPRGSKIVGGIQGPQQGILWTDVAVWAMQYSGQPFVYGFNEIGTGCGLIAPKAAASLNGVVYWMGKSQFYRIGPNGVEPLYCPIWDVIFQDLDTSDTALAKIRVAVNSQFNEIAWFYPTVGAGGEISSYVKMNVGIPHCWDYGALARTAWINQSVLGSPIGADPNGYLYQHETSTLADGAPMPCNFTTGYFTLSEAEWMIFVDQIWPDMKWGYYGGAQNANVLISFNVVDYPGQTPRVEGPFTVTQATTYVTPRLRGRLVSITVASASNNTAFWRLGGIRYRLQQDGKF